MLLLLPLPAQGPVPDPAAYVQAHRAADQALVADQADLARSAFEKCLELSPGNPTVAYGLACTEAIAGNEDSALGWLGRAAEWGYVDAAVAVWDEDLASIRVKYRFVEILDQMHAAADQIAPTHQYWIREADDASYVTDAAIDDTGEIVAVGQTNGVISLLDGSSGHQLASSPELGSPIWAVTFQPGARTLAALTWEGAVFLWAIDAVGSAASAPPRRIGGYGFRPENPELTRIFGEQLQFDPTGRRLLVAASSRGALLFQATGDLIRAWHPTGNFFRTQLAWSGDGEEIAAWDAAEIFEKGHRVHFLDGPTGEDSRAPLEARSPVESAAYQPGGRLIATGHSDTRVRFWDRDSLELLHEPDIHFPPESLIDENQLPLSVKWLAFSSDGRYLAASTAESVVLLIFDSSSGDLVRLENLGTGRSGEPMEIVWSPDSRRVWLAYVSGCMPIQGYEFADEGEWRHFPAGQLPRGCSTGASVIPSARGVLAVDTNRGVELWYRPERSRDQELLQVPAGYFDGDPDDCSGLWVQQVRWLAEDYQPLGQVVDKLFDPKRVRAARAGVELIPVDL